MVSVSDSAKSEVFLWSIEDGSVLQNLNADAEIDRVQAMNQYKNELGTEFITFGSVRNDDNPIHIFKRDDDDDDDDDDFKVEKFIDWVDVQRFVSVGWIKFDESNEPPEFNELFLIVEECFFIVKDIELTRTLSTFNGACENEDDFIHKSAVFDLKHSRDKKMIVVEVRRPNPDAGARILVYTYKFLWRTNGDKSPSGFELVASFNRTGQSPASGLLVVDFNDLDEFLPTSNCLN